MTATGGTQLTASGGEGGTLGSGAGGDPATGGSPWIHSDGGSGWVGGTGGPGAGNTGGATVPLTSNPLNPAAATGVWTGRISGFHSGRTEAFSISIATMGDGATSAMVTVGMVRNIAPPTDPDKAWPSDLATVVWIPLLQGYAHDARNVRWEAGHLTFTLSRYLPWQAWCQLQRNIFPSHYASSGYACVADDSVKMDNSGGCYVAATPTATSGRPVDCEIAFPLCQGTPALCTCTPTGCEATELPPVTVDLILGEAIGAGTMTVPSDVSLEIHVTQTMLQP